MPGQNYADKTSIQQYESHGGDSQRFNIEHIEGAYYKVKTKVANFYLDVEESKTEEGTDIIIYHPTRQSKSKIYFWEARWGNYKRNWHRRLYSKNNKW